MQVYSNLSYRFHTLQTSVEETLSTVQDFCAGQAQKMNESIRDITNISLDEMQECASEALQTAARIAKMAVMGVLAFSSPGIFLIGVLYGYWDRDGSRALIEDLSRDWKSAPVPAKVVITAFGIIAWPGSIPIAVFLMGASSSHAIQDMSLEAHYQQLVDNYQLDD